MMAQRLLSMALALLCLMDVPPGTLAGDTIPTVLASRTSVLVGEKATEVYVQFDRPVNHHLSSLAIVRDGQVVETMNARLDAAPNVLFARIRTPASGRYVLRWVFCATGTDDKYSGEVPFTIQN